MRWWLGFLVLLTACAVDAGEFNLRLKAFATLSDLPDSSLQRALLGSPAGDGNLDMRLLWREDGERFSLVVDHSTVLLAGDAEELGAGRGAADQAPVDDASRAVDLSWTFSEGARHRAFHRFDRLAVQYRGDNYRVTVGREAVSWGSGKVFNPMDGFAPFAPTTVDRDYKAGEDIIQYDQLFDGGSDLQLLAVVRRDAAGERTVEAGSFGAKWRGFVGNAELELAGGKHFDESLAAFSFRFPVGGALVQTDWVAVDSVSEGWTLSGVINADYSFTAFERTAYVYAEYYRNGWGADSDRFDPFALPAPLSDRLARGEVFTTMRNYAAIGGFYQWHALITQSVTALANLHDGSGLLQTSLDWDPGDRQRVQLGLTVPWGKPGDEFVEFTVPGTPYTAGGETRLFFRWLWFF